MMSYLPLIQSWKLFINWPMVFKKKKRLSTMSLQPVLGREAHGLRKEDCEWGRRRWERRSTGSPGGPALSCPPCGHRQEESQQVYLQGTDTLTFSPLPDWRALPQPPKASCWGPLSPCRRRPPGGDAPVNKDATFQKHTRCEKRHSLC